jgi:negative regulator of sigma-B (phosphoserine phosphatase)
VPDRTSPDWPAALERGIAERALAGETRSGDCAAFVTRADGALVAAIDGLGHGGEAADAAELAADVVARHPDEDPVALLERCHAALRKTRGAVMTVAWFDLGGARLRWTGVGNVEGRLVRAGGGPSEGAFTRGGVVGYNLPDTRVTSTSLEDGDVMVMITDGVESDFAAAIALGGSAQQMADRILAMHAREADDALVVVVRYRSTLEAR